MIRSLLLLMLVVFLVSCGAEVSEVVDDYDESDVVLDDVEEPEEEVEEQEEVVEEVEEDPKRKEAQDVFSELKEEYKKMRDELRDLDLDENSSIDKRADIEVVGDFIDQVENDFEKEDYDNAIKHANVGLSMV